jgi:hypothetical protein
MEHLSETPLVAAAVAEATATQTREARWRGRLSAAMTPRMTVSMSDFEETQAKLDELIDWAQRNALPERNLKTGST